MGYGERDRTPNVDGRAVYVGSLKVPDDIDGLELSNTGYRFAEAKINAMNTAFGTLDVNRLQQIGFTTALTSDDPYLRPRRGWSDIFSSRYTDNADAFRGMLFGDLLISVLAREGKIISGLHDGSQAERTAVFTTSSFADAEEFARKALKKSPGILKQHVLGLYREIGGLLQAMKIDEATRQQLNEIILSPIVLRFDGEKIRRKRMEGSLSAKRYTPRFKSFFPYLTVDELTDKFIKQVEEVTGINLLALRDKAMLGE